MIILWTDYFVFLLVGLLLLYLISLRNDEIARARWRQIFSRPLNIVAALLLFSYVSVGIVDSIHLKEKNIDNRINASGIVSVLDKLLAPLAQQTERSYSAPFALYGLTKEAVLSDEGQVTREYIRLQHAGHHLKNEGDKNSDIARRITNVVLTSFILWAALCVVILFWAYLEQKKTWDDFFDDILHGQSGFPWKSFLGTLGVLLFIIVFIAKLMPYYHILGTGQVGEDVLYQSLKSIRTGLIIGTLTTLVTLPFAILLGVLAGYFKGWLDDAIQYTYTTLSAIPGVLLIAAAVLVMQMVMDRHSEWFETTVQRADARLIILCLILGVTSWTSLCRLLRAEALKLSQMDYIQAALGLGVRDFTIVLKHLVPNVMHIILITVALDFSGLVLAEAVLSYVGVGVDPTTYSWGMMINSARLELARIPVVWWSLFSAFIFMFILVLSANIFSDAIRDMFDPYQRGKS